MAKYYFRLVLLIGGIIGFFALVGSLLPRGYSIDCDIEIAAPADQIFAQINSLENWQHWSSWDPERISGLTVVVVGDPGVGNAMQWTDLRGEGKLWITASQPPEFVEYRLLFDRFPEMSSRMTLIPQADSDRTVVQWNSRGRLPGGPFYGYLAPLFPIHLRYEYDDCLVRLKERVEKKITADSAERPED